ncbi:Nramp family divalent metal transporter [Gimesia aquarii]|uniref:Manganese transport protein MntH n=1 Tax=Gimesia aquarii TaxID=2527964 RepID=A0A517WR99_9PLAN|nr:Nramp family divalent metal transporter [Gimesia aquarii]QDU07780.1 manganese transport protein MntH [Gimesia aquarii]
MESQQENKALDTSNGSNNNDIINAPTDFWGIVKRLGPGLIIAGSIVGSGELIATTKTGAQAGITLLWLIIVGCLIKVFVQIELGRYSISRGETTLSALNHVPGPRLGFSRDQHRLAPNWILWFWLVMSICTIGQLGGIVGGVGQALALTLPIQGDYLKAIQVPSEKEFVHYLKIEEELKDDQSPMASMNPDQRERYLRGHAKLKKRIERLEAQGELILQKIRKQEKLVDQTGQSLIEPQTWDDKIWAGVIAILTSFLLYYGRYNLIENLSTVLVVSFTFITIGNVISLQTSEVWTISTEEIIRGLSFGIPEATNGMNPLLTALAAFGIIGVGATELIAYPYWCLEKGYARFTGPHSEDESWALRAKGWMRVMKIDAFASMCIYTFATLAFFLMGVAVLHKEGLDPDGMRMVSTLAEAYVPVFGEYAKWLFLVGAIAVLYSTFLVANAANARIFSDGLRFFSVVDDRKPNAVQNCVKLMSLLLPLLCLTVFLTGANPVRLVLIAGTMQAIMLPMLGIAALYLRFTKIDARLMPGRLWDLLLFLSCLGLLVAGSYGVYKQLFA